MKGKKRNFSYVVKGDPSPTWLRRYQEQDEEEAAKKAIKESEVFVSKIFYNFFPFIFFQLLYFIVFSILLLPTTFTHTHTHTHDPRPTTSTHYPRPTNFRPGSDAVLFMCRT